MPQMKGVKIRISCQAGNNATPEIFMSDLAACEIIKGKKADVIIGEETSAFSVLICLQ
jgi:hypothetical protein